MIPTGKAGMKSAKGIEHARRAKLNARVRALVTAGALAGVICLALAESPVPAGAADRPLHATSRTVWLCRPGKSSDPCTYNRAATSVAANGTRTPFSTAATARAKKFDCFFLYPTVSEEPSDNSDLAIQAQETDITAEEAAQFSSVCNVWAPMYRQVTSAAVTDGDANTAPVLNAAYNSVLAAWQDYLAHDNHGHPVIFIGHSQGAAMLIRLLRSQIDNSAPLRHKLVSAILLGGNVQVRKGSDVGGSFQHIPTCSSASESGCVIAYSTFPSEPGSNANVGRPGQGVSITSGQTARAGQQVACVNPVTFSAASASLVPLYPTVVDQVPGVVTQWISFPLMYTAKCMTRGGASWLQVDRIHSVSADPRPSVISLGPAWGYHDDDMNLALGNLILDVAYEESTYH